MGELSPDDQVPVLGKYALIEKLGEGYLGPVYRGFDQSLGRAVVVRVLCDGIKWDPDVEELFQSECRALAALQHPNIASIHEVGKEGETHYIVMESLGSGNLQALIAGKQGIPAEAKLSIMVQIAEGLRHAHKNGILHLDLGPGKIHVTAEGNVKIRDFAITHILKKHLPHPIVRWGAPIYLSPEQIQQKGCDERSDIFSAGMVLYELFTYFHPFHDPNSNRALDNILLDAPIPTFERFPDVPPGIWGLLKTCMARDPDDRYQSVDDLLDACKETQRSLAEDTQLMLAELYAALTPLKTAAEQPNASQSTIELFQNIQKLSHGEIKADYVALDRLMAALIEQYPVIQSAAGCAGPEDPRIYIESFVNTIPPQTESPFSNKPIENQDTPLQEQAVAAPALLGDPCQANDLVAESRPLPIESAVPDHMTEPAEKNPPTIEDLRAKFRLSPTVSATGSERRRTPAAALENKEQEGPRRKTSSASRPHRIRLPFYRAAAALLLLIIAAAAYIVLGTDAPNHLHKVWNLLLKSSQTRVNAAASQSELGNTASSLNESGKNQLNSYGPTLATQAPPEQVEQVEALIDAGKFRLAETELKKLQGNYPGSSAVSALLKRLQEKVASGTKDQTSQESQKKALELEREEAWGRRVAALLAGGDYHEAGNVLSLWIGKYPENPQAHEYNTKLEEIQRGRKILNAAIEEHRYRDALSALNNMEKLNPPDPGFAKLRLQIETKMASARAVLTIHRLGAGATLLLDGRPIGTDGEIQNASIPIGQHTVSIENDGITAAVRIQEFLENQQVVFVYDAAKSILRPMSESDEELLAHRERMEEVHSFELAHEHGLFRGSCRGVLSIDYYDVAYKPFSGQHGFRIPFKNLKIEKIEGKSVDLSYISDDKHFESFEFQDENEAERFVQIWGDLKAILH